MAIKLGGEPRFDTRGLPEGYDPHKLYEYRLDTLIKNSSGLESFLYKVMPLELVKSLAFAIDPTAPFKVSPTIITPANRTRYRGVASVLNSRRSKIVRYHHRYDQIPNYQGVLICWSPYTVHEDFTFVLEDLPANTQDVLHTRVKDTTKRTRLFGSSQGTFEKFKSHSNSPPRSIRYSIVQTSSYTSTATNEPACTYVGGTYINNTGSSDHYVHTISPTGATLSEVVHDQLRDSETTLCKALCQKHAVTLLRDINPLRRDYTLFRNLVELRDIPRSIASLQKTMLDLKKVYTSLSRSPKLRKVIFNLKGLSKDVPNEYLSYHFGWKQLYRDVSDLLSLPEKTSKKVNFLMARSGKDTTLRAKRTFLSGSGVGVSGYVYNTSQYEHPVIDPHTVSRIERTSEVRLVVNCNWDFPPINSVEFKKHVFAQRTGIAPRVTDIYNLIPWTWLVDWFTGLGKYVELIDDMNHDKRLFNWGMITCVTKGSLVTDISSGSYIDRELRVDNQNGVVTRRRVQNRHTSRLDFECQTRSDVSTILDVNLTSVPSTLTDYQMSILGALIAQRSNFKR